MNKNKKVYKKNKKIWIQKESTAKVRKNRQDFQIKKQLFCEK
jgi:hypothetical protein